MKAPTNLIDSVGNRIQLGVPLGRGGEGTVYELALDNNEHVAKIYHHSLDFTKQAKLRAMVQLQTRALLDISTWPINTILDDRTKAIVGFVMPKMNGYKEIHMLYGPSHRRSEFKDADWAFLVRAARNTAAAIATCHKMGHVVGDINPNNIVVSQKALAKLIDCDSFQVEFNRQRFLCEVGVPHFTPPELQGKQFNQVVRTQNHDNFGLALLCFHLLFMGRHPYAGRFRNGTADMPIERAIREFRFAYSSTSASKQMSAPPNAPSLSVVPHEIRMMFELAFHQQGALSRRPTSEQWVAVLDRLEKNLITCSNIGSHKYHREYSSCPWCQLECQSGVQFFLPVIRTVSKSDFDLSRTWADILAVAPVDSPAFPQFSFNLTPLPFDAPIDETDLGKAVDVYGQEKARRDRVLSEANLRWQEVQKMWGQHSAEQFDNKRNELRKLYDLYKALTEKYESERKTLEARARELQLQAYLRNYYIDRIKISGIGPTRAATLASYGVETAADINRSRIMSIPGFKEALTYELVKWRLGLEQRFVFDTKKTAQLPELMQLQNRYSIELTSVENTLRSGARELTKIRQEIIASRKALEPEIEKRARAYQQATIDVEIIAEKLLEIKQQHIGPVGCQTFFTVIMVIIGIFWLFGLFQGNGRSNGEGSALQPSSTHSEFVGVNPDESNISSSPASTVTQTTTPTVPPLNANTNAAIRGTLNRTVTVYFDSRPTQGYHMLDQGTEIEVLGKTPVGNWCKIRVAEGEEGWLYCVSITIPGGMDQVPIEAIVADREQPPEQLPEEATSIPTHTPTTTPTNTPRPRETEPTASSPSGILFPHPLTAYISLEQSMQLQDLELVIRRIDFWEQYIVFVGEISTRNSSECLFRSSFSLQVGQNSYELIPRSNWVRNRYGINSPGTGFNGQCVSRNTTELIVLPFRVDVSQGFIRLSYNEASLIFNRTLTSLYASTVAPLPTLTPTSTATRTPTGTPTNTPTPTVTFTPAVAAFLTLAGDPFVADSPFIVSSTARRVNIAGTVTNRKLEFQLRHIDFWDTLPDGSTPRNDYYAVFLGKLIRTDDGTPGSGCVGASDVALFVGANSIQMARKLRAANEHYNVNFPGFILDLCLSRGRADNVLFVFDIPAPSEGMVLSFHNAHLTLPASIAAPD